MSRRSARKSIIELLYSYEFDSQQKASPLSLKKLNKEDRAFVVQQVQAIQTKQEQLSAIIKKYSKNWKFSRISLVDRNIMRLAVFEILFCEDIPDKVAVNEALELAKIYSNKESSSFVNGILASVLEEKKNYTDPV